MSWMGISNEDISTHLDQHGAYYATMGFFTLVTLPLAYGHLIRAGMFAANLGFRAATDYQETSRYVLRNAAQAISDTQLPGPVRRPLWDEWSE